VAQSNVKLTVDARGAISALNNTSLATNKLSTAAKGTTASLVGMSTAAKSLGASLAATMGPIIALGAAFSTVNSALRAFSDRERDLSILRQGLENLGEGTASLNKLQEAASKLGDQTLFNQEEFTRGFNLLTSFRKIGVDSYERVAQAAADVAQLNQVDVKTSFMQLAKALEDPERNLSALNRSGISFTKTQTEMIKTLMKANKTGEAHSLILDIVGNAYNKTAQAAAKGFAGQVDSLGEAWRDFGEALGKAVLPVLSPVVQGMTDLLKFLTSAGGKAAAIIAGITLAVKGLSVALPLLQAQFNAIKVSAQIATGQLVATKATLDATAAGFATATAAATAFKIALAKTGIGLAVIALGYFVAKIIEASDEQKRFNQILEEGSAATVIKEIEKVTETIDKLEKKIAKIREANGEGFLLIDGTEEFTEQLNTANKQLDQLNERLVIAQGIELWKEFDKTNKEIKAQNAELEKSIERAKLGTEEEKKAFDLKRKSVELIEKYGEKSAAPLIASLKEKQAHEETLELIKKKQTAAEELKEAFKQVGDSISTNIRDNLVEAIKGTKSLGDMARNIINDLADSLIRLGVTQALKSGGGSFFSGLSFANGGSPPVGKASLVGERGPELFVPNTAGTIIPNNQISGGGSTNIVINVDASGSSVEGDSGKAEELGIMFGEGVRSVLIDELRPGGLLV